MIYPRKEIKEYGTKAAVEGVYEPGQIAVVLDDLITTGGSKVEAIDKLVKVGLVVKDICVLIERQKENESTLEEHGFQLHTIFKFE
ncbi:MAG: bifunctional orotidine-5'-phosphate decarboxylase/orotate phosphoribosyltransferase, partial [Gammaproteobacteria bacterium]|nr:bifunctional orotidine-5'-phosphate decarboxylase/orotate phosphoribosyltransferase [Gammaproteobacteria bacterium]